MCGLASFLSSSPIVVAYLIVVEGFAHNAQYEYSNGMVGVRLTD